MTTATITLDGDNKVLNMPNLRVLRAADKMIIESNHYPEMSLTFDNAQGFNLRRRMNLFKLHRGRLRELLNK